MDQTKLLELTGRMLNDPAIVDGIRDLLTESLWKQATADTWPELFDGMTQSEIQSMSIDDMEAKIRNHVLYSDGTNKPRGVLVTSPRSPRSRPVG